LEDDLMRLFGSDRIANIMNKMGIEDGEVIEHSLITKSVERAQRKVEENNFAIRKRLLEFDNVMNQQREVIYTRRRQALEGERLKSEIFDYLNDFVTSIVENYFDDADIQGMRQEFLQHLLIDIQIDSNTFESLGKSGLIERVIEAAKEFYRRKENQLGSDLMARIERFAVLSVIDEKWKDHLREMDDLKEGINLRAYGQKDPLLEYKGEAFNLFVKLLDTIRNEIVSVCFKLFPTVVEETETKRTIQTSRIRTIKEDSDNLSLSDSEGGKIASNRGKQQPIRVEEKIGRNDPCPCGSGKKYKNCHGKQA